MIADFGFGKVWEKGGIDSLLSFVVLRTAVSMLSFMEVRLCR